MKRPIHTSHRMGKAFTDVKAPAGTPRFYGVRQCKGCGSEEIEHAAGQFTDDDLGKPCQAGKERCVKHSEFQRGILAAADVARSYDSTSTHPYRLGDCIAAKLNVSRRKPRRNRQVQRNERDAWLSGYAVALAEMHRRLAGGNDSTGVCEVALAAGLTLKAARATGVSAFDLKELKRAGVR